MQTRLKIKVLGELYEFTRNTFVRLNARCKFCSRKCDSAKSDRLIQHSLYECNFVDEVLVERLAQEVTRREGCKSQGASRIFQCKANDFIVDLIAGESLPLLLVDSVHFHRLIYFLNPTVKL